MKMNAKPNNQHGSSAEPKVKWLAGWYSTRLHAVRQNHENWPAKAGIKSLCGEWVSESPYTDWAAKRLAAGLKKCVHCERRLLKLSASRKATTTINGDTNA